jgi:hypothetical protein
VQCDERRLTRLTDQQSPEARNFADGLGRPHSLREPQQPLTTADTAALGPGSGQYYRLVVS